MTSNFSSFLLKATFKTLLFGLTVFFAACASGSKTKIPDLSLISPLEIQKKVEKNAALLKTFEGRGKVIIELPGEGYSGNAHILVKNPDSVYVKLEAVFGIDVGALFIEPQLFAAYAPRENILYYGETKTLDLTDFLHIDLQTEKLPETITGLAKPDLLTNAVLSWDAGSYLITSVEDSMEVKYWVDAKKNVLIKSEVHDLSGNIILLKEFMRFRKTNGIIIPQTVRYTRPAARERLTLYYTQQLVNKELAAESFRVKTAKNAKKIFWGNVIKRKEQRKSGR